MSAPSPSGTFRSRKLKILSLAFALLTVMLVATGRPLMTEAAGFGIVSFQLARDVERAEAVIQSWDHAARRAAHLNLYIDFPYLVVYSWMLSLLCAGIAARSTPRTGSLGRFLGRVVWLAGVADAGENIALLRELVRGATPFAARVAWAAASFKFALLAFVASYLLIATVKLYLEHRTPFTR